MEWLTQPVQVWQVVLWLSLFFAIAVIIFWRERDDVQRQIERNETQRNATKQYTSECISKLYDDIGRLNYAVGKLEMQVRELQTLLWKRWLRKIAA